MASAPCSKRAATSIIAGSWPNCIPNLDAIYYDIKILDNDVHKRHCGVSNERILDNFAMLRAVTKAEGRMLLPRIPLIPDITDTMENIGAIARFLRHNGVKRAALLSYNPTWREKCVRIGDNDPWHDSAAMGSWPAGERLARSREILGA